MKDVNIQYYVEGEDEKKLLEVLKNKLKVIKPGKVLKLNVVTKRISDAVLRTLKNGTIVVLVFDTDTKDLDILEQNIKKLKEYRFISSVITIPQVPNLEGELIHSCNIKRITELLNSRSKSEFKSDLIHVSNLDSKLTEHGFDIKLFWNQQPKPPYHQILNEAYKIKIER
ncbi:MAG: hypothetical protein E7516_02045 [Ruminococcaceae bacterium]|nr:hypothetical protein [Oscillospiraceae bacterium]